MSLKSIGITVEKTTDMFRWTRWAQDNGIDPKWFKLLKQAASDNSNWFVVERTIPVKDFISVDVNGKEIENLDQWLTEYKKIINSKSWLLKPAFLSYVSSSISPKKPFKVQ